MTDSPIDSVLSPVPAKRYFTIGEVSELCDVKSHILRYWEQEFTQLKPVKRRGNRRYYQRDDVDLVRRIRQLLHVEGYTIQGARQKLGEPEGEPAPSAGSWSATVSDMIGDLEQIAQMLSPQP